MKQPLNKATYRVYIERRASAQGAYALITRVPSPLLRSHAHAVQYAMAAIDRIRRLDKGRAIVHLATIKRIA